MNVLMVEPGIAPYEKEINGLSEMQAAVEGPITAIYPFSELTTIVCNDESLNLGMEFNRSVEGGYGGVFGPFFVCGISGDDFCSLTPEQMERYKKKYHQAEILLAIQDGVPAILKVDPIKKKPPTPPKPQKKQPRR